MSQRRQAAPTHADVLQKMSYEWLSPEFYSEAYKKFIHKKWKLQLFDDPQSIISTDLGKLTGELKKDDFLLARDLRYFEHCLGIVIGEINRFYDDLRSLAAWKEILNEYDDISQKFHLIMEFVEAEAQRALSAPHAIKDRFIFIGTKTGIFAEKGKKDKIPPDHLIKNTHLEKWIEDWQGSKLFIESLSLLNTEDYLKETNQFRNRNTHRIPIHIDIGIAPDYEFRSENGRFSFSMKYSEPIKIDDIVRLGKEQFQKSVASFECFRTMIQNKIMVEQ